MKAKEIYPKYKLWMAQVKITQPNYVGYVDAQVWTDILAIRKTRSK